MLRSTCYSKYIDVSSEYVADWYRSAKDGSIEADRGRL